MCTVDAIDCLTAVCLSVLWHLNLPIVPNVVCHLISTLVTLVQIGAHLHQTYVLQHVLSALWQGGIWWKVQYSKNDFLGDFSLEIISLG